MMIWLSMTMAGIVRVLALSGMAAFVPPVPDDFPRFVVPGHEKSMETLRALYYLHYQPPAGPLATMWDEWMGPPTLWPAVTTGDRMNDLRQSWARTLSSRHIEPDGYVATHQHPSIAHQYGWPFPFWAQGQPGAWGWHFAIPGLSPAWHGTQEKNQEGWVIRGAVDRGIANQTWNLDLTAASATVETPPLHIEPLQSPFLQLRWRATGMGNAQPFIEWTTQDQPEYGPERRFFFPPATDPANVIYTMIPVYQSPAWKGTISRLRIQFDNPAQGTSVGIQSLFTQYDTRHSINNSVFVRGCCQYFWWTRDLNFLRNNIQRMRMALLYAMTELGGREHKCIVVPWVGHCGRSGVVIGPEGRKIIRPGVGIGHNYWDIMPMGHKDIYGTIRYYDALRLLAGLEHEIAEHPEWNIPGGPLRQDCGQLRHHAEEVKTHAGQLFWNKETGRFTCGQDIDGKFYDYGHTFLNCEAVYYGFATEDQARSIVAWMNGDRIVKGDTAQGADIYRFRFGPRATTKRNLDYYFWGWSSPESLRFGDQVQDGGAVLGWAYHDMMSRLAILGPDSAWNRLKETINWFDEVSAAGGYREYYKDGTRGTLQGSGTPGGLGCDQEFFESILVPQVVIDGFLGWSVHADGFTLNPRLPRDWPQLTVTRIRFQGLILDVTATSDEITIKAVQRSPGTIAVGLPAGHWDMVRLTDEGKTIGESDADLSRSEDRVLVDFDQTPILRLVRQSKQ